MANIRENRVAIASLERIYEHDPDELRRFIAAILRLERETGQRLDSMNALCRLATSRGMNVGELIGHAMPAEGQ